MFAQINLAGSQQFRTYGPSDKSDCQYWLFIETRKMINNGIAYTDTYPRLLLTNAEAKKARYKDGSHVFRYFEK